MTSLVFVRHGPPLIDPALPPPEWGLADTTACAALASVLPDIPMVASDEPKSIETASATGRTFFVDARLREVWRPWMDEPAAFKDAQHRYVRGEPVDGWEPQDEAYDRFAAAADGIVVTHGTVMTLFIASHVSSFDPVAFIDSLRFPDAWELTDGALRRLETLP